MRPGPWGIGVAVPLDEAGRNDLPALTRAIEQQTRALYLVNPHNPTGTVNDRLAFDDFRPRRHGVRWSSWTKPIWSMTSLRPAARFASPAGANVAVFRTLAKIYGLAGLPIGYTVAPPTLARSLRAVGLGDPHAQGRLALAAASAALADQDWVAQVRRRTLAGRRRLTAALDGLGLRHSASHANFVFFQSPVDAAQLRAKAARGRHRDRPALSPARHMASYRRWNRSGGHPYHQRLASHSEPLTRAFPMSRPRQLHLGAFMRPVSIHTGAWRYPGAWPDANFNLAHLKRLIRTLEEAKFDAFFMADHLAVLNMPIEALKRSHTATSLSPSSCSRRWP
jgi:hypothetical protein